MCTAGNLVDCIRWKKVHTAVLVVSSFANSDKSSLMLLDTAVTNIDSVVCGVQNFCSGYSTKCIGLLR